MKTISTFDHVSVNDRQKNYAFSIENALVLKASEQCRMVTRDTSVAKVESVLLESMV